MIRAALAGSDNARRQWGGGKRASTVFRRAERCPLSGVKRTSRFQGVMSAFNPKRTLPTHAIVFRWIYPVQSLIVAVVVAFPTYFLHSRLFQTGSPGASSTRRSVSSRKES